MGISYEGIRLLAIFSKCILFFHVIDFKFKTLLDLEPKGKRSPIFINAVAYSGVPDVEVQTYGTYSSL